MIFSLNSPMAGMSLAGSTYRVTCKELGMDRVEVTLAATTFDLQSIV